MEPSWVDLGSSWVPSWGQNRALALGGARFFENRLFEENEGSRGDLGRSWVDLGRPRGVKMRATKGQKRNYVEMGGSWQALGESWAPLETVLNRHDYLESLGGVLNRFFVVLRRLGRFFWGLKASWAALGRLLGSLGHLSRPSWAVMGG